MFHQRLLAAAARLPATPTSSKLLLRIREPAVSFSAISRFCTTGDDLSQSGNGWFSPRVFFSVLNHSCRVSKEKRRDGMETASNVNWSFGAFFSFVAGGGVE